MKKCYYEVLGLKKPSSEDEIRKAYKKMALKWHPDKNPDNPKEAEERFKEVGEAYAVLSDKGKKELYDEQGHEGFSRHGGGSGGTPNFEGFSGGFNFHSAEDLFNKMFGKGFFDDEDDDFFGDAFSRKKGSAKTNSRDPFGGFGFGSGFGHDFGGFGFDGGSGFGGVGKSTSTSTIIRDGKQVTVKKVTTVNPDGTKTTEVTETVNDGRNTTTKQYIEDGPGKRKETSKTLKQK